MAKKIEVAGHFVTDCVNVVGPCECVIDGDSQELEGANLFNLTAIDTYLLPVLPVTFLLEWMSMLFVFKVFNLKPFLWSQVETGLE